MEIRKLIKFGKNSHVISIPKRWLEKNKLNKGDIVSLEEGSREIIISPKDAAEKPKSKEITIKIDNKNISQIKREIVSSYIQNFNKINIVGNNLKDLSEEIKSILHMLMAIETVEQTSTKITARDFLDMEKMLIKSVIKKMDITTRDMISDSKEIIDESHNEHIYNRDRDVNRLAYLSRKIIKAAMNNPRIAKFNEMDNEQLLNAWRSVWHIERIADSTKRISRFFLNMKRKSETYLKIIESYSKIEKVYKETMSAYYTKNEAKAHELAEIKPKIIYECNQIKEKHWKENCVSDVIGTMKSMITDIHSIGRMVYT